MNIKNLSRIFIICLFLYSCANYKTTKEKKIFYSSSGFALIFHDDLYKNGIINKKINHSELQAMHDIIKINTPIKIINPVNSKTVETKIFKKGNYPKIFNIVISKKIANILELDLNNPYVEVLEIKKNKTFIAKKTNTFEEEKNVAEMAPIDEIQINDLSSAKNKNVKKKNKSRNFVLVINDFYYEDSAIKLKNELVKKTKMKNMKIKKINDKKYRLLAGPFKNFNALKTAYISLNNLGFEQLNIYIN